jgi:hypothetical protein
VESLKERRLQDSTARLRPGAPDRFSHQKPRAPSNLRREGCYCDPRTEWALTPTCSRRSFVRSVTFQRRSPKNPRRKSVGRDRVNEEDILSGHFQATRERFAGSRSFIFVLHEAD